MARGGADRQHTGLARPRDPARTLTVVDADRAKAVLEAQNFRMKFGSFAELIG
jgi:hypothetical protein